MSLRDEYMRERRRIQSYITRLKNQGHNVTLSLPDEPKRITPASVMRLKKITPEVIRRRGIEEESAPLRTRRRVTDDARTGRVRGNISNLRRPTGNPQNLKPHPENLKRGGKGGKGNAQNLTPHPENLQRGRKGGKGNPQNLKPHPENLQRGSRKGRKGGKGNTQNLTPHPENLQRGGRKKGSKNKRPRKSAPNISTPEVEVEVIPSLIDKIFARVESWLNEWEKIPAVDDRAINAFRELIPSLRDKYGDDAVAVAINKSGLPSYEIFYNIKTTYDYIGEVIKTLHGISGEFTHNELAQAVMDEVANIPEYTPVEIDHEWYYLNENTGEVIPIPTVNEYEYDEYSSI